MQPQTQKYEPGAGVALNAEDITVDVLLSNLTSDERERALERFRVLKPFLEDDQTLQLIAVASGQSLRNLRRWVRRYRAEGLAGLSRKARRDGGQHRVLTTEIAHLIEGLALQKPPLTIAVIHRQVRQVALGGGFAPPSYSLVYQIVRGIPDALMTLAQDGTKAYSQTFDLVHRREADGPNAIWQADHCLLDILLVREGEPPAKPWLTIVLDDYSRAVAGYFLTFDAPSALNTSLALRQAIWRKENPHWHICGIPDVLYTDNGSDFTSLHQEQVAADLKIRLVFSLPGHPRGRGRIERFFQTVQEMFLCELPGYSPEGGAMRGKPTLTLRDLSECFGRFLYETYHVRVQNETGTTPNDRWEANGFLPRMADSLEQLDLLLITVVRSRKVHPDGIHFLGMRYIDPNLAAYVGESVILRYDPRDVAEVRVFQQDRFLCRAVCQELAGETVPLRDVLQARNRRRRELKQTLADRQRMVDSLLQVRRWNTEDGKDEPTVAPALPALKRYIHE